MTRRIVMGIGVLLLLVAGGFTFYVKLPHRKQPDFGIYWKQNGPMPPMANLAIDNPEPSRWLHGYHIAPDRRAIVIYEFAANAKASSGFYWRSDPGDKYGLFMINEHVVKDVWLFGPGLILITIAFVIRVLERRRSMEGSFPVVSNQPQP